MYHSYTVFVVNKRPKVQPLDEFIPIGRIEYVVKIIGFRLASSACRDSKKVQVVIAERQHNIVASLVEPSEGCEVLRASIDKVANGPEGV